MSFLARFLKARGKGRPGVAVIEASGPSSYVPGGFTVDFRQYMERLRSAAAMPAGGYVFTVASGSISGAACKVQAWYVPDPTTHSGSPARLTEVLSGTDLSAVKVTVVGLGE